MKYKLRLIKVHPHQTEEVIKDWDIPKVDVKRNLSESSRNVRYEKGKGRIKVKFLPTLNEIKEAIRKDIFRGD